MTEVETPIGKFKTNVPALVLFVLGFIPLFYPIYQSAKSIAEVPLRGEVTAQQYPKIPIDVYAAVRFDSIKNPGSFNLSVPFLGTNCDYTVLYVVGGVLQKQEICLKDRSVYQLEVPDFSKINTMTFEPNHIAEKPAGFQ